jgi:2-C-methyl-D-erythritol 4-phosphate cytidylyltransferase
VRHVVVAAPADGLDQFTRVAGDAVVIPGGNSRTESVRAALSVALQRFPDVSIVLVHDAARAFTPPELISSVVAAVAAGAPAVVPVLPVADTIKRVDHAGIVVDTPYRADLRVVQTPQGFHIDVLRRAYLGATDEATDEATDDAGLVERIGVPVHTIAGHPSAMKITTPFDLRVAESLL